MPIVLPDPDGLPEAEAVGVDGAVLEPGESGECEECSCTGGDEPLYRRWCPCNQPGCWPSHQDIWIKDGERPCVGNPPTPAAGVIVIGFGSGRWCYTATSTIYPLSQIPPLALIIGVNLPPAIIDCDNSPINSCDAAICNPNGDGEPAPCPCGCEATCFVPDYSGGIFHTPWEPGDPPCRICCWAAGSVNHTYTQKSEVLKQLQTYGFNPNCGFPAGECGYESEEWRQGAEIPQGTQEYIDKCLNPSITVGNGGCCRCYRAERRQVKTSCVFPATDLDTGWVDGYSMQLCLETPNPPSDTGWVTVTDFLICNGSHRAYAETRYRSSSNCGAFVVDNQSFTHTRANCTLDGNGVACVLDESTRFTATHTQAGASSNCCGGCRQSICGDYATGGGCGPLPVSGEPVGPPIDGGGGPITPNLIGPGFVRSRPLSPDRQTQERGFGCSHCGQQDHGMEVSEW